MANQTVTVDKTLSQVVTDGLASGQNLTINSGAIVTVDASPSILVGQVSINEGELLLDGANAVDPIVYVGEASEEINVNGAGTLRSTLGWWEFPTLGDGTSGQTFDCSTYYASAIIDADVFSGVWVETGRRINYVGGSGVAPVVGDWLFKTSDNDVHGRITEVVGDVASGYVVVRFLTGILANNDAIELHTLQDNNGPDYQRSWNALANGADTLEAGTFQEFANVHQNGTDYLTQMGSGIAGFAFQQAWQSNTLLFGDGTAGFIVPVGARVRVPMVHISTGTIASVGASQSTWENVTTRHELETVNGGDCYLAGVSFGSAHFEDNLGNDFQATYCAANHGFGVYGALQRATYDHCIFVPSINDDTRSSSRSLPAIVDMVSGADIRDCLTIAMNDTGEVTQFGGQTSLGVNIERCIQIGSGTANEAELLRVNDFTIDDFVLIGCPLVSTTSTNGTINLLKTQRAIGGTLSAAEQIIFTSGTTGIIITGWEVLQHSRPDDTMIVITDSSQIEVRGFHFIDAPYDNDFYGGVLGEEFMTISGLCADITFARCWQTGGNPNEFGYIVAGTSKNITVQNCSAAYAGEVEPDGINTLFRGLHSGSGSIGSTTGLETDYPGTAGAMMGDVFESNTKGYIYCRGCPGTEQYPITVLAGKPIFTKDGDVDVKLGDQWELDMGYSALGHTGFTGVVTTTRNGSVAAEGVDLWTGVDIDFQYDTGTGYNGTWLDLRTPANLTGIAGTVDGVRLKLRFTGNSTQVNGQALTIHTTTTIADQAANLYPIDVVEYTFTNIVPGSRLYVEAVAGGAATPGDVLFNRVVTGTEQTVLLNPNGLQPVAYKVRKGTTEPFYKTFESIATLTGSPQSFRINQEQD